MKPFDTVLIANRGEIAVRIIRTARALGYRTVAVYSEADAGMPHVLAADRAVCIGPPPATDSYLNSGRLIAAARQAGAEAVHPGYGFLSENADFAEACAAAGLVFVGPPPAAIRAMADKARAKAIMQEAGVPCVPGYDGADQSEAKLAAEARRIGYPVMIKAVAGGGGKGMRLVTDAADFGSAVASARSEATQAFGRGDVLLEKAIIAPRHVEVQVFGDQHGNVVHLGDRDCSIQRRHQKVIEEAPAPGLDSTLRDRMGRAAVEAARAVDYVGAGTVEFLVDAEGQFYFLEMNTRLQVEHPVTEMVTGLDLVAWQLRIAAGEVLPLKQAEVELSGHSIEVRLYAEDPETDFLPQSGDLLAWVPPDGVGIRTDHALRAGMAVSTFYDPMIAKVIAHGRNRAEATLRLRRALEHTVVLGLRTNRRFLLACLAHPAFTETQPTTRFIADHMPPAEPAPPAPAAIAVAATMMFSREAAGISAGLRFWRSRPWGEENLFLDCGTWCGKVAIISSGDDAYRLIVDGRAMQVRLLGPSHVSIDGVEQGFSAVWAGSELHLCLQDADLVAVERPGGPQTAASSTSATVRAPMPGMIIAVHVAPDAHVAKGDILLVLSAMKMELRIASPASGRVTALHATVGAQVPIRHALAVIEPD